MIFIAQKNYWKIIFIFLSGCGQIPETSFSKQQSNNQGEPWHLFGEHRINICPAWELSKGAPEMTIAIIDDGFSRANPAFSEGQCSASLNYYNFLKSTSTFNTYHGTKVASLISTCENNPLGLIGINRYSRIIWLENNPYSFISSILGRWALGTKDICSTYNNSLNCKGFNYYQAQVINLSFGHNTEPELRNIIDRFYYLSLAQEANKQGSIIVASAGNSALNADKIMPAAISGVIAVGATTKDGNAWSQSNWGHAVQIMAPGAELKVATADTSTRESGTSGAAPIISAVISLMRSVNTELNWKTALYFLQTTSVPMNCEQYCIADRNKQVQQQCIKTCCKEDKQICTPGRVDAGAAVARAKEAFEHGLPLVSLIDSDFYLVRLIGPKREGMKGQFRLKNVGGTKGKYKISFLDKGLVFSNQHKEMVIELAAKGTTGDSLEIEVVSTADWFGETRIHVERQDLNLNYNFSDELIIHTGAWQEGIL
jgi:subtilisin family serine protease